MLRRLRWLVRLTLFAVLATMLPPANAAAPAAGMAPVAHSAPRVFSAPQTIALQSEDPPTPDPVPLEPVLPADLPSLNLTTRLTPDPLAVGETAVLTVTITNQSPFPAADLALTLPTPASTTSLPGPATVGPTAGWAWTLGALDAFAAVTVTATLRLDQLPQRGALLLQPQATARDLPGPVRATGGALVLPTRVATATASYTPSSAAQLQSSDGTLTVDVPPGAADRALTFRYRTLDAARADLLAQNRPLPSPLVGERAGFPPLILDARDAQGVELHQFSQPLTLTLRYRPDQLIARAMAPLDLTFFWFDEATRLWVPTPTSHDAAAQTVSTVVDHFSAFTLGDGSSPSDAYLPTLQGWQVSLFTGAASFNYPITVPAGPNGIQPAIALSYSSAGTDGSSGMRTNQQAGLIGKGWSLDLGSITSRRIVRSASTGASTMSYALTVAGESYDLSRGVALVGSPDPKNPTHWDWRPGNESFIRVRAVTNTTGSSDATVADGTIQDPALASAGRGGKVNGTLQARIIWQIWTKDGTKYEYKEDLWNGWDRCAGLLEMEFSPYKWLLSTVTDTHGNTINYSYNRQVWVGGQKTCSAYGGANRSAEGTVDRDAWPTEITWAGGRYRVRFTPAARSNDTSFDAPCNQYGNSACNNGVPTNTHGTPRDTKIITNIIVESQPTSGSWQRIRQYNLSQNYALYSDARSCSGSTCSAVTSSPKLTLNAIQQVGKDGTTALPALTFGYQTSGGSAGQAAGGWQRLNSANNNQEGTVSYSYANIETASGKSIFQNRHRVTGKTLNDGRGNNYTWSYSYSDPAMNSLGSTLGGKLGSNKPFKGGYTQGPHSYPNSAALYLNMYSDYLHEYDTWLAHRPLSEFRGHKKVTETDPNGTKIEHWFYQGDAGCYPGEANNTPIDGSAQILANSCFLDMRAREFFKGREYQTQVTASGATNPLRRTNHTFTEKFFDYGEDQLVGLWRAFVFESQTNAHMYNGGSSPKTKTTIYYYDVDSNTNTTNGVNASGIYGNLAEVHEFNGGTNPERVTMYFYAVKDTSSTYITDRQLAVYTYDNLTGTGLARALRFQLYDGQTTVGLLGTAGALTRESVVYDLPTSLPTGTTVQTRDTTYSYDQWGNRTSTRTYTSAGTATSVVVSGSAPAGWTVSAAGSGSTARTTTMAYDGTYHALPTSSTNPLGHEETAAYDMHMGTLIRLIGPNSSGNSAATGFDCSASTASVPSSLELTCASYDVFGRLTALIKPGDSATYPTVKAVYADSDKPFRYQVRRLGTSGSNDYHETQLFYDGLGRQIQRKQEGAAQYENYISDWRYDGLGQQIAASQPRAVTDSANFWKYVAPGTSLHRKTLTSYDGLGRVISVTDPNSKTTTTSYSSGTYATRAVTTDPKNHATTRETDLFGRLRQVKEHTGPGTGGSVATTSYSYTPLDQLSQVDDADANRTTMTYDSLGRKTSMDDPDMGVWNYTYDVNGNLKTQTDGKSQVLWFGYDDLDRPTEQRLTNSSGTRLHKHTYDGSGFGLGRRTQLDAFTSGGGIDHRTVWAYDARGRTSQATHTGTSYYSGSKVFSWGYDPSDRVTSVTYPDGDVATTTYNLAGQPATLTSATGGPLVSSASYIPLGQPDSWTFGNGVVQDWTYSDPLARLNQMTIVQGSTTRFNRSYGYDDVGNVTAITNNVGTGNDQTFGYDHRDRLTSWVLDGTSKSYQYNEIGNLMNNAGTAYSYPASGVNSTRPHAVSTAGGSYTYDQNGNLTSGGGRSYAWNIHNQPVSVTSGGVTETYSYNGDGARTTKTRSGSTTVYLEGLWEQTGGVVKSYYTFNGQVVAVRDSSDTTNYPAYLHGDHLGSVSVVTNSVGGAVTQEFDPWGKLRSGGIGATKRNYTGQYLDDTGLLFYNARYYDPALGRFVSADTVVPNPGNPQDFNRYSYVNNNPVNRTDPTGHCSELGKGDDYCREPRNEDIQSIDDGYGDVYHRTYEAEIADAVFSADELFRMLLEHFEWFANSEASIFTRDRIGAIQVGEKIGVAGPGVATAVYVSEITANSFTLVTAAGHVEAGAIQFSVRTNDAGNTVLRIESESRARDNTAALLYDPGPGKGIQTRVWTHFIGQFKRLSGGHFAQTAGTVTTETYKHPTYQIAPPRSAIDALNLETGK